MSRVLLICPEPLGHGQPAGIGIRFIEIAKVLVSDGHRVTTLSPDGGAVPGTGAAVLSPESIAAMTVMNDVAVVQGHAANALFAHGTRLPTVVDLYDPFIIENLHYPQRDDEVFRHDFATLTLSLTRGDFFLCASDSQRFFYLGLLLACGRINPGVFAADPHLDRLIGLAPFGVQPPRHRSQRKRSHDLLFGGVYDWYDPALAIEAVAIARRTISDVTLTFTRHPNPEVTPQGKLADAMALVKAKRYDFVKFEPWFPYEKRGEFFDRFAFAVMTFRQSIETDLSMRTRVFDYLWGGLPVVTSSAPGTDEVLLRYGAGSVVTADDPEPLAREITRLLQNDVRLDSMIAGSASFVSDHQWANALEPLRAFCNEPRMSSESVLFAIPQPVTRPPSILARLKRRIGGSF